MIVIGIEAQLVGTGLVALGLKSHPGGAVHTVTLDTEDSPGYRHRSNRVRAVCRATTRWVTYRQPDLVVMGGMPSSETASGQDHCGLWHGLYGALDAQHIPVAVVPFTAAVRWATGALSTSQECDTTIATQKWLRQADTFPLALAATRAAMGALKLNEPPFEVKERHRVGLEAVAWPSNLCAKPEPAQVRSGGSQ